MSAFSSTNYYKLKMIGIEETPHEVFSLMTKASHVDKETTLVPIADSSCPNWTSRTQKKATARLCQDKVGQFFEISASQKRLADILSM